MKLAGGLWQFYFATGGTVTISGSVTLEASADIDAIGTVIAPAAAVPLTGPQGLNSDVPSEGGVFVTRDRGVWTRRLIPAEPPTITGHVTLEAAADIDAIGIVILGSSRAEREALYVLGILSLDEAA